MYAKKILLTLAVLLGVVTTAHAVHNQAIIKAQVNLEGVNTPASATHFTASLAGGQEVPAVSIGATGAFVLDARGLGQGGVESHRQPCGQHICQSPNFAWSAPVGPGGRTTVEIIAETGLMGRIVGARGYYTAQLSNGQTGEIIDTWLS